MPYCLNQESPLCTRHLMLSALILQGDWCEKSVFSETSTGGALSDASQPHLKIFNFPLIELSENSAQFCFTS